MVPGYIPYFSIHPIKRRGLIPRIMPYFYPQLFKAQLVPTDYKGQISYFLYLRHLGILHNMFLLLGIEFHIIVIIIYFSGYSSG